MVELLDTKIKVDPQQTIGAESFRAIEKEIGGQIEVSDLGDIHFKEHGSERNININSTASGITNIGLIALLLKRQVITKGSFLFIDEPEVNLHPRWQKVMIETLYQLSLEGVNVVIASHSIDMMKTIENIISGIDTDQNAEIVEQHFAINQMTIDGTTCNEELPVTKKLAAIKTDLGKPFYEMFIEQDW